MSAPRVEGGFEHTREPNATWLKRLGQVSPRSRQVPYLHLHWLAGWPHAPVQRWVLYEIAPREMVHPDLLAELDGPNPREIGRWVQDSRVPQHLGGKSWVSDSLVSYDQWLVGRQTRGYPLLYWIVQGSGGGHRWLFSNQERRRLRMMGLPDEPPVPGELPYAEPNEETWRLIAERDRLKRLDGDWKRRWKSKDGAIAIISAERREAEAEFRGSLDKWLRDQMAERVDSLSRTQLVTITDALPEGPEPSAREIEEVETRFLYDE